MYSYRFSDGNEIDQVDKKLRRKKAVKSKRRHTTVSRALFRAQRSIIIWDENLDNSLISLLFQAYKLGHKE